MTLIWNETRALLPAWLACVAAAAAAALTSGGLHELSMVAFGAGAVGLGAQSIGHDYANGTLGLTLTLPVDRRRLFLAKLAVAGAMVLPLAVYAWRFVPMPNVPALPWLVAAAALCLAPAFTMLCRSPLAGAVLSMSVPGTLFTVMMFISDGFLGRSADAERALLATWSRLMIPVMAAGALLGWRLFMRLESIDGGVREFHLTSWMRTATDAGPAHPLWQLTKKELHLQQLTFAMTALFLATAWPSRVLFRLGGMGDDASFAGATIYWLGIPVLAGSLAIAGERQLGTLPWQLQLPTPSWQQWAVKVATVLGLAPLLAIAVPLPIARMLWPDARLSVEVGVVLVIVVTAASLYVSSLCATGVRAAVASLATVPFGLWPIAAFAQAISRTPREHRFWAGQEAAWLALLSVVVVLLLGFAFVNYRPDRPAAARVARQVLALAAVIGAGIVLVEAIL